MEQKSNKTRELCAQFITGGINGAVLGVTGTLLFNALAYAELWAKGLLEDSHIVTFWMPFFKTTILAIFIVGIARGAYYAVFKNAENTIFAWQMTGGIAVILLYLSLMFSNLYSSVLSPETFQWRFAESLNLSMWITVLIVISGFNVLYVIGVRLLNRVFALA